MKRTVPFLARIITEGVVAIEPFTSTASNNGPELMPVSVKTARGWICPIGRVIVAKTATISKIYFQRAL
jgi:hypothetical protein